NNSEPGAISFTRGADVSVGQDAYRIAGGDINGDGFMDLAVSNRGTNLTTGRSVSILTNDGSGGFTESRFGADLATRFRPWAIALADFNGDSHPDLVVGDMDNGRRIVLWPGNGDGSFGEPIITELGSSQDPAGFAVADFNGDGKTDLAVVTHNSGNEFAIIPGNGDGTFGARQSVPLSGNANHFVKVADLKGDGVPDLLLGGSSYFHIATNAGDGTFETLRHNFGSSYGFAAGDLDGDGVEELVVTQNSTARLRVLSGLPTAPLAVDDTATDVLHGYGRGSMTDGADKDYWRFQARRGELLTVAMDNSASGSNGNLQVRIYDEAGAELTYFTSTSSSQGNSAPVTIPRDGAYYVMVEKYYYSDYRGEYRFRVSLMPQGTQLEKENNNSLGQANPVEFALQGNRLSATLGGYLAGYDSSGDWFDLGNLAAGIEISADLRLPSTSPLTPTLTLYKTGGGEIATTAGPSLVHTVQPGAESNYY
ncbi:MAG: VCBS repeat-containing protein, partial [Hyphomicrobiales bacterium]